MTHEILPFLLALPLPLLWIFFAIPLIYRLLGDSVPLNLRKRWSVKRSPEQSIFLDGVLYWAIPMFGFRMTDLCLRWRLYGNPADHPTSADLVNEVFASVLGGVLFGFLSAYLSQRGAPK
jgi:hypothetical protein